MVAKWTTVAMWLRWPIVVAWLAVIVVGFWASSRLSSLQSNVFSVPGTDSEHVRLVLQRHFGDRSDGALTVVFRVPDASDPATRRRLQRVTDRAAHAIPTGQGTALEVAGRHVLYGNVISTLNLAKAKEHADDLVAAVVRAVMVPALMAVMGRYNWWLPARVARVVRVQPSPLRAP